MTLWTDADKQTIARHWKAGLAASKIGKMMGVTRSVILGILNRNPELRGGQVRQPGWPRNIGKSRAARKKAAPAKAEPPEDSIPLPPAKGGTVTVGRPLVMMAHAMCRWPVNDAERGALHLFCGAPADGTYCAAHIRLRGRHD